MADTSFNNEEAPKPISLEEYQETEKLRDDLAIEDILGPTDQYEDNLYKGDVI